MSEHSDHISAGRISVLIVVQRTFTVLSIMFGTKTDNCFYLFTSVLYNLRFVIKKITW